MAALLEQRGMEGNVGSARPGRKHRDKDVTGDWTRAAGNANLAALVAIRRGGP